MITQLVKNYLGALRAVPSRALSEKSGVSNTTCWRAVNDIGSVKLSTLEAFEACGLFDDARNLIAQRLRAENVEREAKRLADLIDGYPNDEKLLRQEYFALTGKAYRRRRGIIVSPFIAS